MCGAGRAGGLLRAVCFKHIEAAWDFTRDMHAPHFKIRGIEVFHQTFNVEQRMCFAIARESRLECAQFFRIDGEVTGEAFIGLEACDDAVLKTDSMQESGGQTRHPVLAWAGDDRHAGPEGVHALRVCGPVQGIEIDIGQPQSGQIRLGVNERGEDQPVWRYTGGAGVLF